MSGFFDDASWVLIPEGIKEDVVYAQKPTDGLGDLQFTRASDATRTNSAGVIERTPWNLVTFSEVFSDAAWTKTATTITANTITAPNGALTADTLTANGANSLHTLAQIGNAINGVTYTQSIYAKRSTNNFIQIIGQGAIYTSGAVFANFDLLNGTLGSSGGGAVATITNVGNGWYRCTMTATATTTTTLGSHFFANIIQSATSDRAESSTLTTSVFIWGAQVVEGTDAKPYFATTNRQDVPRLDYRNADGSLNSCPRLLLEPPRTNSIRNSTMVGAVAGSPGTFPTNWATINGAGLTRTVVGIGTENGLPYIDLRFNGTSTGISLINTFETSTSTVAATGQVWTGSFYIKTIATPSPPNSFRSIIIEYTSGGGYVRDVSPVITATSNLNRVSQTETLAGGATTARVLNGIIASLTNGATYDFTIRIAAPQMELGAYATTFIPTTTAAVTRLRDAASKTGITSLIGQTEGTIFLKVAVNNANLGNGVFFECIGASTADTLVLYIDGTNNNLVFYNSDSSGPVEPIETGYIPATTVKIALAYKNSDFAIYVNGVSKTISALNAVPSGLANIYLNSNRTGGEVAQSIYNQVLLFPTRLTNAQLAEITTL